ncbi:hypothetical protein ABT071_13985 [Streptomyces sp. NPDC002506]|uniref:hypothetical protein n=1 Tax=Streptomyces sp. NPDC002506 TaxID=3154536 RepID=UPI00332B19F0
MDMFRLPPENVVEAYQTYSIVSPSDVTVRAACEQVGCEAWRHGWESVVNEATDLGRAQAAYIRTRAGRTFREQRTAGGFTVFRFDSGQRCFAEHQTRPELYVVQDGDWRGNPTGRVRRHSRPQDWVEDFGEHQQAVKDQVEKG